MEVERFLMNDWEMLWEEDSWCDSWRNLKLALLTIFATITTVLPVSYLHGGCLCYAYGLRWVRVRSVVCLPIDSIFIQFVFS